ncbi:glyoxal oxidase [Tulasnella calospora MUT 4182]|uniref:Glyoxal oxidase n=1 Tax=Tulasnella calospora MUT 4182 TaxID=1051891 RepID=A0A0C3QX18_9AGAM|nr:glyoxal oxidase [Tulasnella calospora MUT 4182]
MTRPSRRSSTLKIAKKAAVAAATVASLAAVPGARAAQPTYTGTAGQFTLVGDAGVSAQQIFLGSNNKVYVIDKTENNPVSVAGHPAWATEYDVNTNQIRAMDVISNTFCAGGAVLGNGTWLNVGGNQAVTWGGNTAASQTGGAPYDDLDGGKSIRLLTPCEDQSCQWVDNPALYMTTRRWYPTLETLEDGSIIIIGGNQWGGFVNDAGQNNPTYEFFPSRGAPVGLNLLNDTLPANLFPLTFLLPSGNLFIQTNWAAEIFDYKKNVEYRIGEIPHSVRTYPGSAANVMLPLTPANGYTATIIFCGGTNLQPDQWTTNWAIAAYPADDTCVRISPDVSQDWIDEGETLPDGRSMGNFILLPDETLLLTNGANTGTAGYGNNTWAIGHSYADNPLMQGLIYDPNKPVGSRMTTANVGKLQEERMYHSSAVLLLDGSVWISGSNPNPDYIAPNSGVRYPTRTSVERYFPWYYDKTRPDPQNLPSQLGYGGPSWDINLTAADLLGPMGDNLPTAKVVIIRTGFSTHAFNMGQRYVQLNSTYTGNDDGTAVLHVQQLPPNAAILPPGPAVMYVVVNGVPSMGQWIMVGSGQIGTQTVAAVTDLPASFMPASQQTTGNNGNNNGNKSAAGKMVDFSMGAIALCGFAGLVAAKLF